MVVYSNLLVTLPVQTITDTIEFDTFLTNYLILLFSSYLLTIPSRIFSVAFQYLVFATVKFLPLVFLFSAHAP